MGNIIPKDNGKEDGPTEEELNKLETEWNTRKSILVIVAIYHSVVFLFSLSFFTFIGVYNLFPSVTRHEFHQILPVSFFSAIIAAMYYIVFVKKYMPYLTQPWRIFYSFGVLLLTFVHLGVVFVLLVAFIIADFVSCGMILRTTTGGWAVVYWLIGGLVVFDMIIDVLSIIMIYGLLRRTRTSTGNPLGQPIQRMSQEERNRAIRGGYTSSSKIGEMATYVGTGTKRNFVTKGEC